jgi:hypothetical protein
MKPADELFTVRQGDYIPEKAPVMSMISSNVRHLKFLERFNHEMVEVMKRWDDIAARKTLGWAEGYAQDRFGIGATIKYRIAGDKETTLLAWFENCSVAVTDYSKAISRNKKAWISYDCKGYENNHPSMLVGPVDLVQGPEGVIPSLCALYVVEKEVAELFEANLYEVSPYGRLEVGPYISKRPIGPVLAEIVRSIHGTDGSVHSPSEVTDDVTHGKADVGHMVSFEQHFTHILPRIRLIDSYPHAILDVPCNPAIQNLGTLRGPMGF